MLWGGPPVSGSRGQARPGRQLLTLRDLAAGAGTAAKGLIVSPVTHGRRKGNARLSVSASTPDVGPAAVAPPSALSPYNEERAKLAQEGATILGAVLPVGAGRRKSSAGSGHIDFGAAPQHKPVAGRRAQQK